jgi:hypothetical protein
MEILLIIGVSVGVIGLSFLYNYYRNKGLITSETLKVTGDLLLFAKIIINKNLNSKTVNIEKVFDIIRNTIEYVESQNESEVEQKQQLALSQIILSLENIGIKVDFESELLIQVIVDNIYKSGIKGL